MKLTSRARHKIATATTTLTSACGQESLVDDGANTDFDADMEVDASPDDRSISEFDERYAW
jgi:hypothetical protein